MSEIESGLIVVVEGLANFPMRVQGALLIKSGGKISMEPKQNSVLPTYLHTTSYDVATDAIQNSNHKKLHLKIQYPTDIQDNSHF